MNFFGVGPAELILILVVALIFVGPQRLPRLAADLARTIREIRRYTAQVAADFNEVVADLEKEADGEAVKSEWKEIGVGLGETASGVREAVGEVAGSIGEAQAEASGEARPAEPLGRQAPASAPRPAEEPR